MAPPLTTVHIGYDNFFTRPGVIVTPPTTGWTKPARAYDANDILLAGYASGTPTTQNFTVDLGAGNDTFPSYLYIGKTNLGPLRTYAAIFYSTNGIAWTLAFFAQGPADMTSAAWAAFVPVPPIRRYWRVAFGPNPNGLYLGELMLGKSVYFTVHPDWNNDPTAEDLKTAVARTEAGHVCHARFLGSSRRSRVRLSFADHAWVEDATLGVGFRSWVENYVLTGKPFLWGWNLALPGPYPRDPFLAKARGAIVRRFANSYHEGYKTVEFELVGAREWGAY